MYKFSKNRQIELTDFNQPFGMKLNPENRWVKKADMIPWDAIEEKYAKGIYYFEDALELGLKPGMPGLEALNLG